MNFVIWLRDTARFFGQHWIRLFSITLLISLITLVGAVAVLGLASGGANPLNLARLVLWVGGVWMSTAILYYIHTASAGSSVSPLSAIQKSADHFTAVFGYQLLLIATVIILGLIVWLPIVLNVPNLPELPFNLSVCAILFYFGSRLVALGTIDLVVNKTPLRSVIFSAWRYSRGRVWTLLIAHLVFFAAITLVLITLPLVSRQLLLQATLLVLLIQPIVVLFYIFVFQIHAHQRSTALLSE
ncbi:hypothetical protein [Saccharospirillum mangrovi]|uniref:hypothetical protein n=1 Tax=Saccharospirillum mangrovi TaxID=2161747 RepID=UPI000D3714F5|nr:hypothetical protein [Saccharospirillum mangrovi]